MALFGLIVWIYSAGFLYALFFGLKPIGLGELVTAAVSTPTGIAFLVIGNLVGTFIAALLFSISVVAYPMLIDRDVDFVTAMSDLGQGGGGGAGGDGRLGAVHRLPLGGRHPADVPRAFPGAPPPRPCYVALVPARGRRGVAK